MIRRTISGIRFRRKRGGVEVQTKRFDVVEAVKKLVRTKTWRIGGGRERAVLATEELQKGGMDMGPVGSNSDLIVRVLLDLIGFGSFSGLS